MGGRGEPFTLCSSVELPFSLSSVVVVKDRILFNWVPSIDVDSSESWVTELCTLWCSNCFLLQNLISRKIMMAATTKQMKKVTATEMPIAADTCELELSCPGSIVAIRRKKKKTDLTQWLNEQFFLVLFVILYKLTVWLES